MRTGPFAGPVHIAAPLVFSAGVGLFLTGLSLLATLTTLLHLVLFAQRALLTALAKLAALTTHATFVALIA